MIFGFVFGVTRSIEVKARTSGCWKPPNLVQVCRELRNIAWVAYFMANKEIIVYNRTGGDA